MQIEWRDLESLLPYANNPRTHSDEQVAQIVRSMVEFGFTNPVLIDGSGGIIAGHGRIMGAKRAWEEDKEIPRCPRGKIPCIVLGDLNEVQRRAYVIADNKIALNAGWDDDLLREELLALKEGDFDLDLVGFSKGEMEVILEGWGDEIAKSIVGAAGETLEGIDRVIKITCSQEEGDLVLSTVREALQEAGLGHLEIK